LDKRVFLDVQWKMHSLYREMVDYPPPGYEFVSSPRPVDKIFRLASRVRFSYALEQRYLSPHLPLVLAKSYVEKYLKKPPPGTVLTYACEHLIFRDEDWVVGLDGATELVGGAGKHVGRFKKLIEGRLASHRCKGIICYYEAAKRSMDAGLDCTRFAEKVSVLPFAVRSKQFRKAHEHPEVRLLFVGSINIPGQFEIKGGKEAVEAFCLLGQRYDGLRMVVRSDMPSALKKRYQGVPNLRIIDKPLPWEELEREFMAADIFLLPAHCTVAMAMLDAMSYELPVVTTDVYANPELVQDGVTGFLVRHAEEVPFYDEEGLPVSMFTPTFTRAIRETDRRMVEDVVRKTSVLIENPELRKRMGAAGRREVEEGRFSIARRNHQLKQILDRATMQEPIAQELWSGDPRT
jgi:glycosyltransferase involved in cell wall biosynthesis